MPRPTAFLLNERGQLTLHECIRLEVRLKPRQGVLVGRMIGVYPIYQCTVTHAERIYGCLAPSSGWEEDFPGVPVEQADDPALDQADDQAEQAA